jgi:hypothetical protein
LLSSIVLFETGKVAFPIFNRDGVGCYRAQLLPFATMSDKPPSAFLAEYNAGHGEPFTKGRRPVSLAFACDVSTDRCDAIGAVWFVRELTPQGRHTKEVISELNGWPACALVNASPAMSP